MRPSIRNAVSADLGFLPAVEEASDTLLGGMKGVAGLAVLPPAATKLELAASRHILVAGKPPVGFARLEEVGGQAHLEPSTLRSTPRAVSKLSRIPRANWRRCGNTKSALAWTRWVNASRCARSW